MTTSRVGAGGSPADRADRGATLVEYTLLVAAIAAVCLVAIRFVGDSSEQALAATAEQLDTSTSGGSPDAPGGGGGDGGGDSSTPTTTPSTPTTVPSTPTTTVPPTTTTVPPAPPEDPEVAAQTDLTVATASGSFYEWSHWSDEGKWQASFTFANGWDKGSFVTFEVTRTFDNGYQTKDTIRYFYVPAGGSSTFTSWSNGVEADGSSVDGVVSVSVKVTSITTTTNGWDLVTHEIDDVDSTVPVPALP